MKAQVFSHNRHIGPAELLMGDVSMGGLYGNFIPSEDYYQYIQKHVWEFWSTSKPDYDKWSAMGFNVQLDNGYFLFAQGGYTIDDIADLPDEPKRIDIAGVDSQVIEDFFLPAEPRPLLKNRGKAFQLNKK